MVPIVSIVGTSDCGKTTLIEQLLPRLIRKGYRVATVKHDVHGFEIDREGKDSWRHKRAGASTVVLSSPERIAVIRDVEKELTLEEIRNVCVQDVDLIVTEGYKRSAFPKIEVNLTRDSEELLCKIDDNLVAVVSNRTPCLDVPFFRADEIERLADWLEEKLIKRPGGRGLEVHLSGRSLPLHPLLEEVLERVLRGVLSSLSGRDRDDAVEIRLAGRKSGMER